jgi:membrane protein implicated in regulation of membrane protease activity
VDAPAQVLAALATIALLFAAVVQVMLLARHRREVEAHLDQVNAEMDALRERLAEATRPPTQFARMRLRESAVYRFARLRRAVPRQSPMGQLSERARD